MTFFSSNEAGDSYILTVNGQTTHAHMQKKLQPTQVQGKCAGVVHPGFANKTLASQAQAICAGVAHPGPARLSVTSVAWISISAKVGCDLEVQI